jgi:hypothetical protein
MMTLDELIEWNRADQRTELERCRERLQELGCGEAEIEAVLAHGRKMLAEQQTRFEQQLLFALPAANAD